MAVRTIRRNPMKVNTDDYYDDLNEGYFNFTSFNGINSKQNYISIDQQSFEDAKNVYLDQNAQLSTRPIVGKITVLPNNEKILRIIKINNLTVYHTVSSSNQYHIYFYMANQWQSREVGEKLCIAWIYDKYFVFTNNSMFAFSYDFDTQSVNWYDATDIVYRPVITEDPNTSQEANIFTDAEQLQYVFQYGVNINVDKLIGNEVTVNIDGENYQITFQLNNDKVFTKPIYQLSNATMYVARDRGNIIAKTTTNDTSLYYSPDGTIFQTIPLPNFPEGRSYIYTISDDGLEIYLACNHTNSENPYIYYMPLTEDFQATSWLQIDNTIQNDYVFTANQYVHRDGSSVYNSYFPSGSEGINGGMSVNHLSGTPRFMHSPEAGRLAIYYTNNGRAQYYRDWTREQDGNIYNSNDDVQFGYTEVNALPDDTEYTCMSMVVVNRDNSQWSFGVTTGIQGYSYFRNVRTFVYSYVGKFIELFVSGQFQVIQLDDSYIAKGNIRGTLGTVQVSGTEYLYVQIGKDIFYDENVSDFSTSGIDACRLVFNNGDLMSRAAGFRNTANQDVILRLTFTNIQNIPNYVASDYSWTYTYNGEGTTTISQGVRITFPWTAISQQVFTVISTDGHSSQFVIDFDNNVLTESYYYYQGDVIPLIKRVNEEGEVYAITPLYIDYSEKYILYYSNENLYSSAYPGTITVSSDSSGTITFLIPDRIVNFIGATNINVFSINNKLYWTSSEGTPGQIYVPESNVIELQDVITNIVVFSQTSLGIFLEDSVYEFMYDTSNSVYRLASTKLQLGCKNGADVLVSYDGSTIYLSTIKGLAGLTYQDFVQSTEQVYNYLTDNILDMYDNYYANGPLKLYQYKYWLFVYRQDDTIVYVYDTRNQSWWKWEFVYPMQQLIYTNDKLIALMNNTTYQMYHNDTIYDDGTSPFDWYILSQKLHFNAPNYYKHVRQLDVITSQDGSTMRYKLGFKNYRNLNNLVDVDTVEYPIEQLNTLIKRVSFMKTNAFQFSISKDKTDKYPMPFVVPDIAIKYRITEAIR